VIVDVVGHAFTAASFGDKNEFSNWVHPRVTAAGFKMTRMYIHCFVFRWKPDVTPEQIEGAASEIRNLQGQIPGLLATYVGRNESPRGQGYSFGGVMKFADKSSFEAYGPHPVHQKLLAWLMPLIEPLELDFEA
jgi:hypothetical protein